VVKSNLNILLTTAGKVVAVIVMFGGIASFGYIAGSLLENIIKKGQGKLTINFEINCFGHQTYESFL